MEKSKINELVLVQLNELNDTLPENQQFQPSEDTVLFGTNSSIDSLSLVSFIVDLESVLSDETGIDISLTDDRAMTREKSPFTNVENLVEYIHELTNE